MKKLDINITKAQLKSYTVELKEGKPVVSATIELLTNGGMAVTTYTVSTESWYSDKNKFDLPMAAIIPIIELAKILENVTVQKCRDSQLALGSGIDSDPITEESFVAESEIEDSDDYANPKTRDKDIVIDIDDKPIDLSGIPF